jgi:hypothetical protein
VTQAIPGTNLPYPSFGAYVASQYPTITVRESPDEQLAQAYVRNLATAAGMQPKSAFSLPFLDELLARALPPAVLIGAIDALALVPV